MQLDRLPPAERTVEVSHATITTEYRLLCFDLDIILHFMEEKEKKRGKRPLLDRAKIPFHLKVVTSVSFFCMTTRQYISFQFKKMSNHKGTYLREGKQGNRRERLREGAS